MTKESARVFSRHVWLSCQASNKGYRIEEDYDIWIYIYIYINFFFWVKVDWQGWCCQERGVEIEWKRGFLFLTSMDWCIHALSPPIISPWNHFICPELPINGMKPYETLIPLIMFRRMFIRGGCINKLVLTNEIFTILTVKRYGIRHICTCSIRLSTQENQGLVEFLGKNHQVADTLANVCGQWSSGGGAKQVRLSGVP